MFDSYLPVSYPTCVRPRRCAPIKEGETTVTQTDELLDKLRKTRFRFKAGDTASVWLAGTNGSKAGVVIVQVFEQDGKAVVRDVHGAKLHLIDFNQLLPDSSRGEYVVDLMVKGQLIIPNQWDEYSAAVEALKTRLINPSNLPQNIKFLSDDGYDHRGMRILEVRKLNK